MKKKRGKRILAVIGAVMVLGAGVSGCSSRAMMEALSAGADKITGPGLVQEWKENLERKWKDGWGQLFAFMGSGKGEEAAAEAQEGGSHFCREDIEGEEDDALILYAGQSSFRAGEAGTMQLTVLCDQTVTEDVCIYDDRGTEICRIPNDGSGHLKGEVSILETEARTGSLIAKGGEAQSRPVPFYVTPEVTKAMAATLQDVCAGLGDFVLSNDYEDNFEEETLEALAGWLMQDGRVVSVIEDSGVLLFETEDHLVGSYGLGRTEGNCFGFSEPSEAFETFEAGESTEEIYLPSGIPITNRRMLHLSLLPNDLVISTTAGLFRDCEETIADHQGLTLQWQEGVPAVETFLSGEFTDAGFLAINTHGKTLKRSDGGWLSAMNIGTWTEAGVENMLRATGLAEEQLDGFWGTGEEGGDHYRLIADVIVENGSTRYSVWLTTNYLECMLADKTFDNTIVYLIACEALSDQNLVRMLLEHGASAVIGCKQTFDAAVAVSALKQMEQVMGLQKTGDHYGTLDDLMDSTLGDAVDQLIREQLYTNDEDYAIYQQNLSERPVVFYYAKPAGGRTFSGRGSLSGRVISQDGQAVADAEVAAYRWIDHDFIKLDLGKTDENGQYRGEDIPYGLYAVKAWKDQNSGFADVAVETDRDQAAEAKDIVLDEPDLPFLYASCIQEYGGVTYCIRTIDGGDPEECSRLVKLPVSAPEGYYVSNFAIYHGKIYYYCKEPGTSGYHTSLYRCELDGSSPELLIEFPFGSHSNEFHITKGALYPFGSACRYCIDEGTVEPLEQETNWGSVLEWYNQDHVFYTDGKYIVGEAYDPENAYQRWDKTQLIPLTTRLYQIRAVTSDSIYYETIDGNECYFYRYDLESGSVKLVDSRRSAGSGWYFGW